MKYTVQPTETDIELEIVHRSKFRDLWVREDSILPFLIGHLDRIDSKVSALLSFDGILVAILTIIFASADTDSWWSIAQLVMVIFSSLLAAASIWICLNLVYLYGYHSSHCCSADEYQRKILVAVAIRTRKFNLALRCLKISVCFLLAYFLLAFFQLLIPTVQS